ncbi:MAG: methylenetetrahydrofolate reductase C-terminal domain-containing protein [Streptosporangiaceae bacterium]|nr:methylenetetrahydrofolate reductase C-terminal domain-containing protein [Streptosporangiaceae bacterium]MBV9854289.1 methylenetetrahydrofolate reductase C-terminal domain-containing protein [Streptosporangiaceae bacterium]
MPKEAAEPHPIRPARPRLAPRTAYLLQRVLAPNAFYRRLAAAVERFPVLRRLFTATEKRAKEPLFGCRMCGQCALPVTGYACPMSCPKELRNGPCGGVGADGSCEVHPEMRCVWVVAYERAASQGRPGDLRRLHRPVDHRRWGESAWLNYWQGREDTLWTTEDVLSPALRAGEPSAAGADEPAPGEGEPGEVQTGELQWNS